MTHFYTSHIELVQKIRRQNKFSGFFFLSLIVLIALSSPSCDKKDLVLNSTGSGVDIFTNASEYTGAYPTPARVTYSDQGSSTNVTAYPGQVIVFFNTPISETDASQIITANGGTILAKIPTVGYYFVSDSVSAISAFITSLQADSRVSFVMPHIASTLSANVAILDGCSLDHGANVLATLQNNGGTSNECRDIVTSNTNVGFNKLIKQIIEEGNQNRNGTTLINLSAAGGLNGINWATQTNAVRTQAQNDWIRFMTATLLSIRALPPEYRENFVITIASGNGNMPITNLMAQLRADSRISGILANNVLVVSTTLMTGNYSTTDPDVAIRNNPEAAYGTSFAAPGAMAIIQNIMNLTSTNAKTALKAAKQAISTNANHQLIQSEAIDKARAILDAQQTDPSNAGTVTAIAFTSVGSSTSAVITPALEGVSVSYTVSGTDGYYDSGTLKTNSSGNVTFAIPPGETGVRDAISVTAVISGVTKSTNYTW